MLVILHLDELQLLSSEDVQDHSIQFQRDYCILPLYYVTILIGGCLANNYVVERHSLNLFPDMSA